MKSKIDLAGKTAVVTGGNVGIGKATALAFARCGADVALTYFTHAGEETAEEIRRLGRKAMAYRLDVRDSADVNATIARVAAELGGHIDILFNNAGSLVERVPLPDMTDAYWHHVVDVNLSSAFYCARAVLPHMMTGWGRIVNMSSLSIQSGGGFGQLAYAAAKAGVIGLTRGLAKALATHGITVNAVVPGLILGTPLHETFTSKEVQQTAIASIPLKRAGRPEDVADTVLYLVSDLAEFVTGEAIQINGGQVFT